MRTKAFITLAFLLAIPCLAAVMVEEYTMPALEAVPYSPVVCGNWALAQLNTVYGDGHTIGVVAYDIPAKKVYTLYQGNAVCLNVVGNVAMWSGDMRKIEGITGVKSDLIFFDLVTQQFSARKFKTSRVWEPSACGNYMAYDYGGRIYLCDLRTGSQKMISANRNAFKNPNVGGDMVVWQECEDSKSAKSRIAGCRISTGQEYLFTEQFDDTNSRPQTDGEYVVWHSDKTGGMAYCIKTGKARVMKFALYPDVGNGIAVYEKPVNAKSESHNAAKRMVCGIDLRANGDEFRISKSEDIAQVCVNGNRVVWAEGSVLHCADLTRTGELKLSGH